MRQAKEFLEKGNKVKVSCVFRGREMMHPEFGDRILSKLLQDLQEISTCEAPAKMFGRMMTMVLAPALKKKK